MDWIKKNYDRFALLLLGAALLLLSCVMIVSVVRFRDRFEPATRDVPRQHNLVGLDTARMEAARSALDKPAAWANRPWKDGRTTALFTAQQLFAPPNPADFSANLVDIYDPNSPMLHPPIPNQWFLDNKLSDFILDPGVLNKDVDGTGFTLLENFKAKVDPWNPKVHPPYTSRLRFRQYLQIPFRMKFEAWDGDTFQINSRDSGLPTQFLKIGDQIEGTKYKVVSFEKKSVFNDAVQGDKDVSELTVENIENGTRVVLVVDVETNDAQKFAVLDYLWGGRTTMTIKKGGTFSLKPELDVVYKLVDITPTSAVIQSTKEGSQPLTITAEGVQ